MLGNNRDIKGINFRISQQEDQDFLWKALYYAVSVPPGSPQPNPEVVYLPMLAQYVNDWMNRPGDLGIVAIEDKTHIGAAWIRKWIGSDQGYGFVDTAIPELSISLLPEYRGIGIGTKLLGLLLEKVSQHYEAVSLSVANYNPAISLYKRHGFQKIGEAQEDSITMICRFKAN